MFTVPVALSRPASKAQFHRAAEAMLRAIADDLGHTQFDINVHSDAAVKSTMGSVRMTTSSLTLEVYMDGFGPREAPRLIYRDRFNNERARDRWLTSMDSHACGALLQELRILARNARPSAPPAKAQGGFVRRFTGLFAA